jgi:hypothetical protein
MIRADLTTSQRAKLTVQLKKAYLAAQPQTKHGGDRKSAAARDQVAKSGTRFEKDTAWKTGRSERSIAQDIARAEALGDDIDRVSRTSLDKGVELVRWISKRRRSAGLLTNTTRRRNAETFAKRATVAAKKFQVRTSSRPRRHLEYRARKF